MRMLIRLCFCSAEVAKAFESAPSLLQGQHMPSFRANTRHCTPLSLAARRRRQCRGRDPNLYEVRQQEVRQLVQHGAPFSANLRSSRDAICSGPPPLQHVVGQCCIAFSPACQCYHIMYELGHVMNNVSTWVAADDRAGYKGCHHFASASLLNCTLKEEAQDGVRPAVPMFVESFCMSWFAYQKAGSLPSVVIEIRIRSQAACLLNSLGSMPASGSMAAYLEARCE